MPILALHPAPRTPTPEQLRFVADQIERRGAAWADAYLARCCAVARQWGGQTTPVPGDIQRLIATYRTTEKEHV